MSDRLLAGIRGCQRQLARCGTDREAVVLAQIVNAFLDGIRAMADEEPCELKTYLRECSMPLVLYALRRCKGNQVHTARMLGISRNNLRDNFLHPAAVDPKYRRLADQLGALMLLPRTMQDRPVIYSGRLGSPCTD